jgi:excisionase family DNA binding protein
MSIQLLSIEGAAERLSLGRSATKAVLYSGRLRSVRLGKRRLIPDAAIAELIEQLEAEQREREGSAAK